VFGHADTIDRWGSMSGSNSMCNVSRFALVAIVLQAVFIVLFGEFVRYPQLGIPRSGVPLNASHDHGASSMLEVGQSYPCESIHCAIVPGGRRPSS